MITWTPEAERVVYDYLNEVARLAAIRGEDAEELHANLMDHIRSEVAERRLELVTDEIARQIVAQLGAPDDIVGESGASTPAPAPPPAQPVPSAPQPERHEGMRWTSPIGCLIATVIGLVVLFVVLPASYMLIAILLPALTRAYSHAELADQRAEVIETLEYIVAAEEAFRKAAIMDRNRDGIADYGTLEDLNAWIEGKPIPYELHGYRFSVDVRYGDEESEPEFHCRADPIDTRWPSPETKYYVNQDRVIRYAEGLEVPNEHSDPLKTVRIGEDGASEPVAKTQYLP